jgi:hypothetical protein
MRKQILFCLIVLICNYSILAQQTETRILEEFNKVNVEGRIVLHLVESDSNNIKINVKEGVEVSGLTTSVYNGELFIHQKERNNDDPEYIVYLSYNTVNDFTLKGTITLFSDSAIDQPNLKIDGSGIIKGKIEVLVENLNIYSSGISNITVSGRANTVSLIVEGIGKINARKLNFNRIQRKASGFARIKL